MDPDPTGLAAATLTVVVNTEWEWNFNEDSGHFCLLVKNFVRYFPAFNFFSCVRGTRYCFRELVTTL